MSSSSSSFFLSKYIFAPTPAAAAAANPATIGIATFPPELDLSVDVVSIFDDDGVIVVCLVVAVPDSFPISVPIVVFDPLLSPVPVVPSVPSDPFGGAASPVPFKLPDCVGVGAVPVPE